MSSAFVMCPLCDRLMLGQRTPYGTYPQPHKCEAPCERGDQ